MELHQLRYVIQVAQHLNFSKAAIELCITQPNLSHQILKLENEIGVTLFERKTRSVKPTPAGEKFVEHAKKVLAELETLSLVMQEFRSASTGTIILGILPSIGDHGLTTHIPEFQNRYPGIQIRIIEADGSYDLIKMLLTGSIDVAYLIPPHDKNYSDQINFHPIAKGKIVLITSKNHRFATKGHIILSDASEERFILPPVSHSMYNAALNVCRSSGFEPRISCECSQLNTLFNLVAKGLGIGFISSQFVESSLLSDVSMITFEPLIERTGCIAILKDKRQLPVISVFRDFILNSLQPDHDL